MTPPAIAPPAITPPATPAHRRRLRELWQSAGWPRQDMIELDLQAAGLIEPQQDPAGRVTLRLTDAGLRCLAEQRQRHQRARQPHEALVARVTLEMQRAGRVVWRGLSVRAPLPEADDPTRSRWVVAMPDVYSIRHTTREDQLLPVVHEVKVSRADLLADLKRPEKGQAYCQLASECWYVLAQGIGRPEDLPDAYGVMQATRRPVHASDQDFGRLEVLRPAPRRAFQPGFHLWMALARATPCPGEDAEHDPQRALGDPGSAV